MNFSSTCSFETIVYLEQSSMNVKKYFRPRTAGTRMIPLKSLRISYNEAVVVISFFLNGNLADFPIRQVLHSIVCVER